MRQARNEAGDQNMQTRRRILTNMAAALGVFTLATRAGTAQGQSTAEVPSAGADKTRTSLHQEVELKAGPTRIYDILLDTRLFTACTGSTAEISPDAGGAFRLFQGQIEGRNVELIPGERIVQAWRPAHWDPGIYSIVKFELHGHDGQTKVVLDHTGFPEGDYASLGAGWKSHYFDSLQKYLAA